MRFLRFLVFVSLAALTVVPARAQFGLYGSPETLRMPSAEPGPVSNGGYQAPAAYPATSPAPGPYASTPAGYAPARGTYAPAPAAYAPAPRAYYPAVSPSVPARGYPTAVPNTPLRPVPAAVYAPRAPQYARPYAQPMLSAEPAATVPATSSPSDRPATRAPPLPEPPEATAPAAIPSQPQQPPPNLVNQMLSDPGCYGSGGYGGDGDCFAPAAAGCERAATGGENGCSAGYCSPWYGSVLMLMMSRDSPNKLYTTAETLDEPNQMYHFGIQWKWGGEIRVGRRFCCDQWAVEAAYWTLDRFYDEAAFTAPGGVSTPLVVGNVGINGFPPPTVFPFVSAADWFDGAGVHRITRRNEVQSVEVNVLRNRACGDANTPLGVDWFVGPRFFRFQEEFTFWSLQAGHLWGENGGANEIHLLDQVQNNLWGVQFGFNADYRAARSLSLFATPKFGLYNNHIEHFFALNLGNGALANTGSTGVPGTYPVYSTTDKLSFMTQLDVGVDWQFAERWGARIGYRVLAATGIALSDNQIPFYLVDIPAIAEIETNGHLILHGAFAGITYNF